MQFTPETVSAKLFNAILIKRCPVSKANIAPKQRVENEAPLHMI